jgi:hypothetical protein
MSAICPYKCTGRIALVRRYGRDKRERHGDDFIAGPDLRREQCQVQRAGAVVDADALGCMAVFREFLFEGDDFAAQGERATLEDALDRGIHFGLDGTVLGLQVYERNHATSLR